MSVVPGPPAVISMTTMPATFGTTNPRAHNLSRVVPVICTVASTSLTREKSAAGARKHPGKAICPELKHEQAAGGERPAFYLRPV